MENSTIFSTHGLSLEDLKDKAACIIYNSDGCLNGSDYMLVDARHAPSDTEPAKLIDEYDVVCFYHSSSFDSEDKIKECFDKIGRFMFSYDRQIDTGEISVTTKFEKPVYMHGGKKDFTFQDLFVNNSTQDRLIAVAFGDLSITIQVVTLKLHTVGTDIYFTFSIDGKAKLEIKLSVKHDKIEYGFDSASNTYTLTSVIYLL
jgi:hypothetical protein